jgi:hypothetical protein
VFVRRDDFGRGGDFFGRMPVDFVSETHRRLGIVCISPTVVFDSHRIMSILMISISICTCTV